MINYKVWKKLKALNNLKAMRQTDLEKPFGLTL